MTTLRNAGTVLLLAEANMKRWQPKPNCVDIFQFSNIFSTSSLFDSILCEPQWRDTFWLSSCGCQASIWLTKTAVIDIILPYLIMPWCHL